MPYRNIDAEFRRVYVTLRQGKAVLSHRLKLKKVTCRVGNDSMTILTSDSGEKALQCDVFEEAARLEPKRLMTLTHQDGTFNYYVIGEAVRRDHDWIVPCKSFRKLTRPKRGG